MVDRLHYLAPEIEVVSIGSGGGSIIYIDPANGLPRIGPRSAGARPGPVCYEDVIGTLTETFAGAGPDAATPMFGFTTMRAAPMSISRKVTRLADLPGDKESIGWGVFPLRGNDALYIS